MDRVINLKVFKPPSLQYDKYCCFCCVFNFTNKMFNHVFLIV